MEIKNKLIKIFDWRQRLKDIKRALIFVWSYIVFLMVLLVYAIRGLVRRLMKLKLIGKFFVLIKTEFLVKKLTNLMYWLDKNEDGGVTRSYLIELAFRNMKSKKNRSIITIGGVALGVGAIVFLVSVGYGLEKLVINKVAKLDELKMADVSLGTAATMKLNDEVMDNIKSIENVVDVIPVVSMVSKIKFNNSVLDVMSFGVNKKYIEAVNPNFVAGDKFEDKDLSFVYDSQDKEKVLGTSQELVWIDKNEKPEKGIFDFNIVEDKKIMVLSECNNESEPLGYAVRSEGGYTGEYVWGEAYIDLENGRMTIDEKTNREYSKWVRAKVPLWSVDSNSLLIPKLDSNGQQFWEIGCFKPDEVIIEKQTDDRYKNSTLDGFLMDGSVLGEATESAELATNNVATNSAVLSEENTASTSAELFGGNVATDSAGVEWVEFKSTIDDPNKLKEVPFLGSVVGEAYVSTGMLKLLGMKENEALGKTFSVSYIIPDGNVKGLTGRLQSTEAEYKIKGVIDDPNSNYYYYQLADAKRLGISVYSQLKVLTSGTDALSEVRKRIEFLGFKTDSTADTVTQIESLFKTLRFILGALGTIALAVASLGMFNTMTVSLLERTREVGVMKTMGMLSNEVRELFLAESMIMGVGGGVLGILFGFTLGKVLSLILTSISIFKGQSMINITYIPWFFIVFIMAVSFVVGMVTGWYPSKRARQISALNALRYE